MVLELLRGRSRGGHPSAPGLVSPSRHTLFRLVRIELRRSLARPAPWLLAALVGTYGSFAAVVESDPVARGARIGPSTVLSVAVGFEVLWLLVLALPLVCGGGFAEDRSSGYLALQRARGVSRKMLAIAHLFVTIATGVLMTVMSMSAIVAVALMVNQVHLAPVGAAVSFAPRVLESRPLCWALLVAGIYSIASATTIGLSSLVGVWRSSLAARAVPPATILTLGFALAGSRAWLNPLERASFLQVFGAEWVSPNSMVTYWVIAELLVALAFVVGFSAKEG